MTCGRWNHTFGAIVATAWIAACAVQHEPERRGTLTPPVVVQTLSDDGGDVAWFKQQLTLLSRVRRVDGSLVIANAFPLGAKVADVSKTLHVGDHSCGYLVQRYCLDRNFVATLTAADGTTALGSFADDTLYAIDLNLDLPEHTFSGAKIAAFEIAVTQYLGAPSSTDHGSSSGTRMVWLRDGRAEITIGFGELRVYINVVGKSAALEDALVAKDKAILQAAIDEQHARMCTCKHLKVGEVWPRGIPDRGSGAIDLPYRIIALAPETCTARVARLNSPTNVYDRSCANIFEIVPSPCPECANQ